MSKKRTDGRKHGGWKLGERLNRCRNGPIFNINPMVDGIEGRSRLRIVENGVIIDEYKAQTPEALEVFKEKYR